MSNSTSTPGAFTVLVGGVGELYQGDLDLGRRAAERLARDGLRRDVVVEEFTYGAIAVAQRLEELAPDALILVGAQPRGREPGTVQRRLIRDLTATDDEVQTAVAQAGTGYVDIDLLLRVAWGFGHLPDRTVVIEVEPAVTGPSAELSRLGAAALDTALHRVRVEVERAPVLALADWLRGHRRNTPLQATPATAALDDLLAELERVERDGVWGRTFAERDRLRQCIADGQTSPDMAHLDWGLWWGVVEELDRLQAWEAAASA